LRDKDYQGVAGLNPEQNVQLLYGRKLSQLNWYGTLLKTGKSQEESEQALSRLRFVPKRKTPNTKKATFHFAMHTAWSHSPSLYYILFKNYLKVENM